MRAIPNMKVLAPDAVAVKHLTKLVARSQGPFYMRLARPSSEVIYSDENTEFAIGKGNIISEGNDATIMSCGLMVQRSIEAARVLIDKELISCRHRYVFYKTY